LQAALVLIVRPFVAIDILLVPEHVVAPAQIIVPLLSTLGASITVCRRTLVSSTVSWLIRNEAV
jgi:hypothetical protein